MSIEPIDITSNSKLLIVDDDARNRKLLEIIFKQEKHQIVQAEDGLSALEKVKIQCQKF